MFEFNIIPIIKSSGGVRDVRELYFALRNRYNYSKFNTLCILTTQYGVSYNEKGILLLKKLNNKNEGVWTDEKGADYFIYD